MLYATILRFSIKTPSRTNVFAKESQYKIKKDERKKENEETMLLCAVMPKKNFCANDVSVRHFNGIYIYVLRMRRMHITLFDFDESPKDLAEKNISEQDVVFLL